jgi:hypothetical protein
MEIAARRDGDISLMRSGYVILRELRLQDFQESQIRDLNT